MMRPNAVPKPRRPPTLVVSAREVELVRRAGQGHVESFAYRNTPARDQPTEWHNGKLLLALAKKLAAYRRGQL